MFKRLLRVLHSKAITLVIAVALILPMVLFFHSIRSSSNVGPNGAAGLIYGKPVSWDTFEREHLWTQQQFGGRLSLELLETMRPALQEMTWERLLYLAEAKRQRIAVSNQELAEAIRRESAFQEEDGHFSSERYFRLLQALGMTPQIFEEFHRGDLVVQKLMAMVTAPISVTDDTVTEEYRREREQVRASLVMVDAQAFIARLSEALTDADLQAQYSQHPESVRVPEQVSFDVIGRTLDELTAAQTATDEELGSYYAKYTQEFEGADGAPAPLDQVREEVKRQVLVRKAKRALAGLAADLAAARDAKRPFDSVAEELQLTPRTVGPIPVDTPYVDELAPEVLTQGLALQPGELSPPVETLDSVSLLRGATRQPAHVPPFEEVRDALRARIASARAKESAKTEANRLRALLQERLARGVALVEAAEALGIHPSGPALITRSGAIDPLGLVPSVNEALFATPPESLTQVCDTPSGYAFALVHERLPVDLSGLTEADRASIGKRLLEQRRRARVLEWTEDLKTRARLTHVDLPKD